MSIPAWELQQINLLSAQNELDSVDPSIIASIDQAESSGQGGAINSSGFGGYFGLGAGSNYPGGTASAGLLQSTTPTAFDTQAQLAASEFAKLLNENTGNVYASENEYQGNPPNAQGEGVQVFAQNNVPLYDNVPLPTGASTTSVIAEPATSQSNTALSSLTNAVSHAQSVSPKDGLGKVLLALDGYMNPQVNPVSSILSLGLSNIEAEIIMIFSRLVGVGIGLGLMAIGAYLGFVQPIGGATGILSQVNQRSRISNTRQRNLLTQQQNEQRASSANSMAEYREKLLGQREAERQTRAQQAAERLAAQQQRDAQRAANQAAQVRARQAANRIRRAQENRQQGFLRDKPLRF